MIVTDIQQQKNNAARYSVFIDGEYSFSLHVDDVLETHIKKNDVVSEAELDTLKKRSEDSLIYTKAMSKCLRRLHSTHEIELYLQKNNAPAELQESVIAKLTSKKLLDDSAFTEHWVAMRRRRNKSDGFIRAELKAKGVASELIEEFLVNSADSTLRRIQILIDQKVRKYPDHNKLIQYLQRQGYRYSDIKEALKSRED